MDVHDTIGFDLVGMVVDDLVVCGAEPLFMTDYIACGQVVPERIAAIVKGIAEACVEAGCALVGGETAEHPGLLGARRVRRRRRRHRRRRGRRRCSARTGSAPATSSSRWRSPACTPTATRWSATCCSTQAGWALDRDVAELGRTLGEELLEPTRIYAKACLALAARAPTCTRSPTSPAAGSPPTWPGCCPTSCRATLDRAHLDAGAGLRRWSPGRRRSPQADLERDAQPGRRHGRAARPPTTSTAAVATLDRLGVARLGGRRGGGSTPERGGEVALTGQHAGW